MTTLKAIVDQADRNRRIYEEIRISAQTSVEQLAAARNAGRELVAATARLSSAVAADRLNASLALTSLRIAGVNPRLDSRDVKADLARLAASAAVWPTPLQLMVTRLSQTYEFLNSGLRPIARTALDDAAQRMRARGETGRRADARLRVLGWWIPPSWTLSFAVMVADYGEANGRRATSSVLCDRYRTNRGKRLRGMVERWMEDQAFAARRPIIREALRNHMDGRYRTSIPALLPLIEGIAIEVFDPAKASRNPRSPYRRWSEAEQRNVTSLLAQGMLTTLTALWEPVAFEAVNPRSTALNRHVILHGRSTRYGTEANSLRVFFALDGLSAEVGAKRRQAIAI